MKDVSATLRRIDEEIVGHKQNIARSQVEIMRLTDSRQVLQRLVEDDQTAEQQHKLERAGIIAGEHAKPVLIVRRAGTGDEEGTASKAAKHGLNGTHTEVKPKKPHGKRKPGINQSGEMREKILAMMDADTPMTSLEIGDYLGLKRNDVDRKPMSNALYQLKAKGVLKRDTENRYYLPPSH